MPTWGFWGTKHPWDDDWHGSVDVCVGVGTTTVSGVETTPPFTGRGRRMTMSDCAWTETGTMEAPARMIVNTALRIPTPEPKKPTPVPIPGFSHILHPENSQSRMST